MIGNVATMVAAIRMVSLETAFRLAELASICVWETIPPV